MAKNITLLGASYSAVPAVTLPQTGGGIATFTDVSDTTATAADVASGKYFYDATGERIAGTSSGGGGGLVHLTSLPTIEVAFEDTAFNGWTPSTTAKAILPTQTAGTFVATDVDDYDYFVRQRTYVDVNYIEGTATAKGMFKLCLGENWNAITRRSGTATTLNAGTFNANVNESVSTTYLLKYYNTSWTALYSSAYGIYPSNTAQTLSSTSATSPTVTVKTNVVNAKCQSTYFSTTMAGKVDQANTFIKIAIDIYRAEGGYMRKTIYHSLADMWLHGLS